MCSRNSAARPVSDRAALLSLALALTLAFVGAPVPGARRWPRIPAGRRPARDARFPRDRPGGPGDPRSCPGALRGPGHGRRPRLRLRSIPERTADEGGDPRAAPGDLRAVRSRPRARHHRRGGHGGRRRPGLHDRRGLRPPADREELGDVSLVGARAGGRPARRHGVAPVRLPRPAGGGLCQLRDVAGPEGEPQLGRELGPPRARRAIQWQALRGISEPRSSGSPPPRCGRPSRRPKSGSHGSSRAECPSPRGPSSRADR